MHKFIWCLLLVTTYQQIQACTILPRSFCNSISLLPDHAILSGVISGVDDTGIDLLIVDVLRGNEARATVRIWDGTDFECNGNWSLAATNIGSLGDSVVVLVPLITETQNDWDIIGDYRWEDPYFYTASLTIQGGDATGFIRGLAGAPPEALTLSAPYADLQTSLINGGDCSGLISSSVNSPATAGIKLNNPFSSMLSIQLAEGVKYDQLNIYSAQGQMLHSEQLATQLVAEIELASLPSGVYFLEIQFNETQRELRKVVKI